MKQFLFVVFCPLFLIAQVPDTVWTKTYGGSANDVANSIQQTLDGGYIIAGYTESFGAGYKDIWLLKTDANGDTIWTKTYGGYDDDIAYSVLQTNDGGYFLVGETESFGSGNADIWLLKTNSLGDTIWTKTYGGYNYDGDADAIQTSDGGFIVTGITSSFGSGHNNTWFFKIDPYWGDTLWSKTFTMWGMHGGARVPLSCLNPSVQETFDGGYILGGGYWPLLAWGPSGWVYKRDSNGDSTWVMFPPTSTVYDIAQTADSGYIICSNSVWHYIAMKLVKTDAQGHTLWAKSYDSLWGSSLQITNDNGYIITGKKDRGDYVSDSLDLFVFKANENGDSLWSRIYGSGGLNKDIGQEVRTTTDGGYIIVGSTESFGAGGSDVWLLKFEPDIGIGEELNIKSVDKQKIVGTTIINGVLNLQSAIHNQQSEISLLDITGRKVADLKSGANNIRHLAPGVYFIRSNNNNQVTKVIITK